MGAFEDLASAGGYISRLASLARLGAGDWRPEIARGVASGIERGIEKEVEKTALPGHSGSLPENSGPASSPSGSPAPEARPKK